ELVKVVEASDVILEVLDARHPLGTRCTNMEKMVMSAGPDKRLVLLLNKIEAVKKWLKYLREELSTVAFKCSTQEQRSKLGWKSSKAAKATCACTPSSLPIIKKTITVGVIGLPNRAHVVNVGAIPGLTRSIQEVQLDKNIKLLDCPGVVMLKSLENDASVALQNCKRIEKLDDPISPVRPEEFGVLEPKLRRYLTQTQSKKIPILTLERHNPKNFQDIISVCKLIVHILRSMRWKVKNSAVLSLDFCNPLSFEDY
ncbi:hypothetical protein S83_056000, partial [Arachis hypogaea]